MILKLLTEIVSAKAEEELEMSIRKKTLYVILLVVMAACFTSMFFSFQPKSAAAWTGTKLITISSDTTWDNIRLDPDTTYEIKKGVTVTLVGKITVRGNITITGEQSGLPRLPKVISMRVTNILRLR